MREAAEALVRAIFADEEPAEIKLRALELFDALRAGQSRLDEPRARDGGGGWEGGVRDPGPEVPEPPPPTTTVARARATANPARWKWALDYARRANAAHPERYAVKVFDSNASEPEARRSSLSAEEVYDKIMTNAAR